ncbi:MAG: hypothetical protein ACXWZL_07785, partial [Mycobacterium sp.]
HSGRADQRGLAGGEKARLNRGAGLSASLPAIRQLCAIGTGSGSNIKPQNPAAPRRQQRAR